MKFRLGTPDDIGIMCALRKKQLVDEGISPSVDIDAELREFFEKKLRSGELVEWLLEEKDKIIATGDIVFYEFPPTYTNRSGVKGYITNMYTKPEYRGQGIATSMLARLAEEAKRRGVKKLWLGASKMGRPVYEKFGFKDSDGWLELNI